MTKLQSEVTQVENPQWGPKLPTTHWKMRCGQESLTQCRNQTDTITGKESSCDKQRLLGRGSLQDNTQIEDYASSYHQAQSATEEVAKRRSGKRAKKGPSGENGYDERILGGGEFGFAFGVHFGRESMKPVRHGQDTGDGARVISTAVSECRLAHVRLVTTDPKRTPPKATKRPMTMAGLGRVSRYCVGGARGV